MHTRTHRYPLLEVKFLDFKINLGNFLRKWQHVWKRSYVLLAMILQAPATISSQTGSSISAGQLARRWTRRPATFLTIVSVRQSVRDCTSFTPFLWTLSLFLYCLNSIFRRKKKNQPKNSSGPKHRLGHPMLRGTRKIWLKHFFFFLICCRDGGLSI